FGPDSRGRAARRGRPPLRRFLRPCEVSACRRPPRVSRFANASSTPRIDRIQASESHVERLVRRIEDGPRDPAIAIAATFVAEPLLPGLRLVLDEVGLGLRVCFAP